MSSSDAGPACLWYPTLNGCLLSLDDGDATTVADRVVEIRRDQLHGVPVLVMMPCVPVGRLEQAVGRGVVHAPVAGEALLEPYRLERVRAEVGEAGPEEPHSVG